MPPWPDRLENRPDVPHLPRKAVHNQHHKGAPKHVASPPLRPKNVPRLLNEAVCVLYLGTPHTTQTTHTHAPHTPHVHAHAGDAHTRSKRTRTAHAHTRARTRTHAHARTHARTHAHARTQHARERTRKYSAAPGAPEKAATPHARASTLRMGPRWDRWRWCGLVAIAQRRVALGM